jgi:hypothetical protein
MVEYWKVGFQPDGIHIIVSCSNFIDNALDHFSFAQHSSIPTFQLQGKPNRLFFGDLFHLW